MELRMTVGCIHDSLTIDGVEEHNLSEEKRKEALGRALSIIQPEDLNEVLQWLILKYAQDFERTETPCECCGDYIETYTLTI